MSGAQSALRRSVAELVADLRRLGIKEGDALMVHASLRRLGPVEGGPRGVIAALDEAVGSRGGLLMILGATVDHEWVNQRPEPEREALLVHETPYDPLAAPVLPEVGYLAEAFRTHPGTIVTDNPSGRFAARGGRATELLRDAPWDDYYGPGSPLDRLCRGGGKVLRLGANPDTMTVLHYAEYLADVPGKRRVRRHYRVQGPRGPETRSVESLDDEFGIVTWPGEKAGTVAWSDSDYFAVILKAYFAEERGVHGRVGNAEAELIGAQDVVDFGARWMTTNLESA
jgi:aminoglycoside N3'-acetyltransferase